MRKGTCPICGDTFHCTGASKTFCSSSCMGIARSRKAETPLTPAQNRLVAEAMDMRMRGTAGKCRIEEPGLAWLAFRRAARNWQPKRGAFRAAVHSALISVMAEEHRKWFKTRKRRSECNNVPLSAFGDIFGTPRAKADDRPSPDKFLRYMDREDRLIVKAMAGGLMQAEVAKAIGVSPSNVSIRLKDIRARCRAMLTKDEAFAMGFR